MSILNETSGGYQKIQTSNGNTAYKDPSGKFTKQQAYAASRQNEQYEPQITSRGSDGRIESSRTRRKDEGPGEPGEPNTRIVGSYGKEYDSNQPGIDKTAVDIEISGVFGPGESPTDEDIRETIKELSEESQENLPFMPSSPRDRDINIERRQTRESATGYDEGSLSIENDGPWQNNTSRYETDPEQSRITDGRW